MGKTYKKVNDWGKAPKKKKVQGVVRPQQLEDKKPIEVRLPTTDWWEDYYPDEDEDFEKFNRRR